MSYSVAAERQAHAHAQRAALRGWPTEGAIALAMSARETVARTVSCAICGHMGITPPCGSWDEADGWLDGIGWQDIDTHPICPPCAEPGGAA